MYLYVTTIYLLYQSGLVTVHGWMGTSDFNNRGEYIFYSGSLRSVHFNG
jgi:hypothetical protein